MVSFLNILTTIARRNRSISIYCNFKPILAILIPREIAHNTINQTLNNLRSFRLLILLCMLFLNRLARSNDTYWTQTILRLLLQSSLTLIGRFKHSIQCINKKLCILLSNAIDHTESLNVTQESHLAISKLALIFQRKPCQSTHCKTVCCRAHLQELIDESRIIWVLFVTLLSRLLKDFKVLYFL